LIQDGFRTGATGTWTGREASGEPGMRVSWTSGNATIDLLAADRRATAARQSPQAYTRDERG
jgi:hypothetical protein